MKKSGTTSITREDLLSSLDIQDWNLRAFAHEICDNIGQVLSLAKIRMATLNPERKEEAMQIMAQSDQLLAKAIQDLRYLARQLTPTEIMQKGFADAVHLELKRFHRGGMCATTFSRDGNHFRLHCAVELMLYSILNRYIYRAVYEEKATYLSVHISYRSHSMNLQMDWYPVSGISHAKQDLKTDKHLLKRARLIEADIRMGESETGHWLHIRIKRNSLCSALHW